MSKKNISPILEWLAKHDVCEYFGVEPQLGLSSNSEMIVAGDRGIFRSSLPSKQFANVKRFANSVFWFPTGLPSGEATLVASSRIGNQPDTKPFLFDALRTLACRFDVNSQFLLTHETIATAPCVDRVASLFELPVVEFRPFPEQPDEEWFADATVDSKRRERCLAYFELSEDCQIDEFLFSIAREIRILSIRKKGNVYAAATTRLEEAELSKVFVLNENSQGRSRLVFDELVQRGAIPWYLFDDSVKSDQAGSGQLDAPIYSLDEFRERESLDEFFLHWTRRRKGPWPSQTEAQFLDDLIMGEKRADHDRMASLTRIIATKKLIANNTITRDSTPVVCFSQITIDQLPDLRTFRSHLSRWDFESVGVAIRRSVLESLGVVQVVYGDDELWRALPLEARPYFQKKTAGAIDWSVEREWRVAGDVDLSKIAVADAFVFVSTWTEADKVASFTNWPVVVLLESTAKKNS